MIEDGSLAETSNDKVNADFAKLGSVGIWMAWAGFGCGLLWWGAAAGIFIGLFGLEQLSQQPIGLLTSSAALVFLPGLIMTLAGLMARQSRQATEANALVLKAAEALLSPAKTTENEIRKLAEATRVYSESVNRTATETLKALRAASDKLEEERLRVESVSYAMADNARELTERLKEERQALESISKNIDAQSREMNEAIPRQAAAIAAAAKQASGDVAEADLMLERQLHKLKNASSTLAVRLTDLEAIAKDATCRTETLNHSLGSIETKLGESQKTIEMAERASSMAVDAAAGAGSALQNAVSTALDSARRANSEITQTTQKVHEDAAKTIAELRKASIDAEAAASKTGKVLRKTLENTVALKAPAERANGAAATNGHNGLRGRADTKAPEAVRIEEPEAPRRINGSNGLTSSSARTASEEDLFDTDEIIAPAIKPPNINGAKKATAAAWSEANGQDRTEWREIIADLEVDEVTKDTANGSSVPLAREETAEQLINRLESSGIPLPKAFKPRDKKRIAAAARKDESARRSAIRQAAGGEVDRVAVRLRKDQELKQLAQHFVMAEEPEALLALDKTSGSKRAASPRLSAYLLVDAALEALGS